MAKILTIEQIRSKTAYQGKDGKVYHKLTKDRQSVVNTDEIAFMKVVFAPTYKEFKHGYKTITNHFMTIAPITVDWDNHEFIEGEQLTVTITKTDYDFLMKYIEPERGKVITATGRTYKNAKGFDMLGRKWGQVTREQYFKLEDPVKAAVDAVDPLMDDDFID